MILAIIALSLLFNEANWQCPDIHINMYTSNVFSYIELHSILHYVGYSTNVYFYHLAPIIMNQHGDVILISYVHSIVHVSFLHVYN